VEDATRDTAALKAVLDWVIERLTANDESRQHWVAAVGDLGYDPITKLDFGELHAQLSGHAKSKAWTPATCNTVLVALEAIAGPGTVRSLTECRVDAPTRSSDDCPAHRTPTSRLKLWRPPRESERAGRRAANLLDPEDDNEADHMSLL
jgi:hypothetical protein